MVVRDIKADAIEALGMCQGDVFYRRLTDAVRRLSNKGILDVSMTTADFRVYEGFVTLPMDVETVLGVTTDGVPTFIRSEWYEYSLSNGGGSYCTDFGYADDLGLVSTFRDPSIPVKLVAVTENVRDNGKALRVFGWDASGKRIYSTDANGEPMEGFFVPMQYGYPIPNPNVSLIARIDRIDKALTDGFVKLLALDPADNSVVTQIGYYQPKETEPRYRRLKVPFSCKGTCIRVKYRKRDLEIRCDDDWINVDNREALLQMCKAVLYSKSNQFDLSRSAEAEAVRLINDQVVARTTKTSDGPTIIMDINDGPCGSGMFY